MATKQQRLCVNQADGEAGYARNSAIQVSSQLTTLSMLQPCIAILCIFFQ
jgi:flagellar basal body rod protein FlgF